MKYEEPRTPPQMENKHRGGPGTIALLCFFSFDFVVLLAVNSEIGGS